MTDQGTVLIIDDSPSVRETISFILRCEGYDVESAANGAEGLRIAEQVSPRVVLTDAMMPEMDGFELCGRLKAHPSLADTVVIMLTSMGQTIDRERAEEVGVDHFVTKPFDEDEVLALIESALSSGG